MAAAAARMPSASFSILTPGSGHSNQELAPLASYIHRSGYDDTRDQDEDLNLDYDDEDVDQGAGDSSSKRIAVPGQPIASSSTFMRGHGSYLSAPLSANNKDSGATSAPLVLSSLAGPITLTNRLISVTSARSRYVAEVGDLVVGRITTVSVGTRRWYVDLGGRCDASLSLSSVNLPGGVQRRKLESDELQMRKFFQEGDLLVAEVQTVYGDGSVGLHTRSLRYGKLRNGALARVPPGLVRRLRSHFIDMSSVDVDLTLGLNGYVWVSKHIVFDVIKAEGEAEDRDVNVERMGVGGKGIGRDVDGVYSDVNEHIPLLTRLSISMTITLLSHLASQHQPISDASVLRAWHIVRNILRQLDPDTTMDDVAQGPASLDFTVEELQAALGAPIQSDIARVLAGVAASE